MLNRNEAPEVRTEPPRADPTPTVYCPICGEEDPDILYRSKELDIIGCSGCVTEIGWDTEGYWNYADV